MERRRLDAEPPTRPSDFHVLGRRWMVERIIAWLATSQRLPKDYERLVGSGKMLLYLAMSPLLLRRLTRKHERWLLTSLLSSDVPQHQEQRHAP